MPDKLAPKAQHLPISFLHRRSSLREFGVFLFDCTGPSVAKTKAGILPTIVEDGPCPFDKFSCSDSRQTAGVGHVLGRIVVANILPQKAVALYRLIANLELFEVGQLIEIGNSSPRRFASGCWASPSAF